MSLTRDNLYHITSNSIHQSIHIINPSAPKSTQISFQWLRFPDTVKISSLNVLQQHIDTF